MFTFPGDTIGERHSGPRGGAVLGRGHGRGDHFNLSRGETVRRDFRGRGHGNTYLDIHPTSNPPFERFSTYGEPATSFNSNQNITTSQHFPRISSNPQADPFVEAPPAFSYQYNHSAQQQQYHPLPPFDSQNSHVRNSYPSNTRKSFRKYRRGHRNRGKWGQYGSRASHGHYHPGWDYGYATASPPRNSDPGYSSVGIEPQYRGFQAPVLVDEPPREYSSCLPALDGPQFYGDFQQLGWGHTSGLASSGNCVMSPFAASDPYSTSTHQEGSWHGWDSSPFTSLVQRQSTLNANAPVFVPAAHLHLSNSSPFTPGPGDGPFRLDFSLTPEEKEIARFLAQAGRSTSSGTSSKNGIPVCGRDVEPRSVFASGPGCCRGAGW
jgi:hypothetical protein